MAKIYLDIDRAMKSWLGGQRTERVPGMRPGVFKFGEMWAESLPLEVPGHSAQVLIRGRFDIAVAYDDGSFGIPDLKTASIKDQNLGRYARQLWSYTYAVENPAPGRPAFDPVSQIGLVVFAPEDFISRRESAFFFGALRWIEIERDDRAFLGVLEHVLSIAEQQEAPAPNPRCEFCIWSGADPSAVYSSP